MKRINEYESPHLALLKSAATEVVATHAGATQSGATQSGATQSGATQSGATQSGATQRGAAIDSDDPLIAGVDTYCRGMFQGQAPSEPTAGIVDDTDPDIGAYLTFLHHRKAHAKISGDKQLEADLENQLGRFKYGNPLWQQMFEEYFKYYWQYPCHKGEKPQYRSWKAKEFGNGDLNYGVIDWRLPADATIAVVGDIGTGTDVAAANVLGALSFKPDAFLHVGDVYFSGTSFEFAHRFTGLLQTVFKDQGTKVPMFTVPGNHEYFTGAVSYLACLDSGALVTSPQQRQSASYFSLRTEDDGWQFQGADTGFHGHYMNVPPKVQKAMLEQIHCGKVDTPGGADPEWPSGENPFFRRSQDADLPVEDPTRPADMVYLRSDEQQWHAHHLQHFPGRSMLFSHHQLYSAKQGIGVAQATTEGQPDPTDYNRKWVNTRLWRQLGKHFGDSVAGWLWGHEHNLGIFQSAYRPADWPSTEDAVFKTLPKGRCVGHSAIPVAETETPYQKKYPVPLEQPDLELGLDAGWYNRGFQIIQLDGAGKPATVSYYQVQGAEPTPLKIFEETIV